MGIFGLLFGNNKSVTTSSTIQESISEILMNVLVSHTQNCSSIADVRQSIDTTGGQSSSVVISNVKFDARIAQQLACLMTAKLTTQDTAQIQAQFEAALNQSTIKFPNLNSTSSNQQLVQKVSSYLSSNINVSSVINSAQVANINQHITTTVGNNSNVIINGVTMEAGMQLFHDVCTQAVQENLTQLVQKGSANGTLTQEEVNALQPLTDAAQNIVKDITNTADNAIWAAITPFIFTIVIIFAIIFAVVFRKPKPQLIVRQ